MPLQAKAYEAARPGYPDAAISRCLDVLRASHALRMGVDATKAPAPGWQPAQPLKVLDLAAGTGKLTR